MGTAKAKRKGDSMRQSRVQDDDGTKGSKGVRDSRVQEMAEQVNKDTSEMKKAQSSANAKR
jgi:hypothetical protein